MTELNGRLLERCIGWEVTQHGTSRAEIRRINRWIAQALQESSRQERRPAELEAEAMVRLAQRGATRSQKARYPPSQTEELSSRLT